MPRLVLTSDFPNARCDAGDNVGRRAISPWTTAKVEVARPLFPPMDRALVVATACQTVAETGEPLSRQSLADLTRRANRLLAEPMSKSTVWRTLDEDAIKPWQYEHWIFPRDPEFRKRAGPILDLYAGIWHDEPLGPKDFCAVVRREDQHSSSATPARGNGTEAGPATACRAGVQARRGVAISGRVGCASRDRDGSVRSENGNRSVRSAGGSASGECRVRGGRATVLGCG